ncbi:MAG: hypothetical protein GWP91_14715 [Rhodobacterales bacterium]|nr:hypothetical protein [Rhodobacterales bacterium]
MRIFLLSLLALGACAEQVDVYTDVDGDLPIFRWGGEDMADLVVIAQDQDRTGDTDGTLMWSIACAPMENGQVPNCLRSPLAYGLVPIGAEQHVVALPLRDHVLYWVSTGQGETDTPAPTAEGDGLFAMSP